MSNTNLLTIRASDRKYIETNPTAHTYSSYGYTNQKSVASIGDFLVLIEPRILSTINPPDISHNGDIRRYIEFESTNTTAYNLSLFSHDLLERYDTHEIPRIADIIPTSNSHFFTIHSLFNNNIADISTEMRLWHIDATKITLVNAMQYAVGIYNTGFWLQNMSHSAVIIKSAAHIQTIRLIDIIRGYDIIIPNIYMLRQISYSTPYSIFACTNEDEIFYLEKEQSGDLVPHKFLLLNSIHLPTEIITTHTRLPIYPQWQLHLIHNTTFIALSSYTYTPEQSFFFIKRNSTTGLFQITKTVRISQIVNPFHGKLIGIATFFTPINDQLIAILGTFGVHIWDYTLNRLIRFFPIKTIDRYFLKQINNTTFTINAIDATLCMNIYSNNIEFIIPRHTINNIVSTPAKNYITLDIRSDVIHHQSRFGAWHRRKSILMWYKMKIEERAKRRRIAKLDNSAM
jgi:hypothetical protein